MEKVPLTSLDIDHSNKANDELSESRPKTRPVKRRSLDISAHTVTSELEDGSSVHTTITAFWSFGETYDSDDGSDFESNDFEEFAWTPGYATASAIKTSKVADQISEIVTTKESGLSLPTTYGSFINTGDNDIGDDDEFVSSITPTLHPSQILIDDNEEEEIEKLNDSGNIMSDMNFVSDHESQSDRIVNVSETIKKLNKKGQKKKKDKKQKKDDKKGKQKKERMEPKTSKAGKAGKTQRKKRSSKTKKNSFEISTSSFHSSMSSLDCSSHTIDENKPKERHELESPQSTKPRLGKLLSPDSVKSGSYSFKSTGYAPRRRSYLSGERRSSLRTPDSAARRSLIAGSLDQLEIDL